MSKLRTPLDYLRRNARQYAAWRALKDGDRSWIDKITPINKALTAPEIEALVGAADGGLEDYVLKSGLY